MTLTLTPAARARFTAWLQDVGSAELRADAVESEMLQIMEDRAESGESMSYELGRQYTTTGQPELFYADAKDFDVRDRITITQSGLTLALKPSDLRIELGNDSITVRAANNVVLFAGYDLPAETHGDYAGWAEWDGCSFATPADRKLFEQTIQSFVERNAGDDGDDDQAHIISAVLGEDAEVIELSFDPERPESQVFYRYPDVSDEWHSCPFQSADLRQLSDEAACAKVNNWVG